MENLTIGQRIAMKRRELGLSQIALGEEMGVSRQSISKWEADAAIPEIDKLIALSKLFGVSVGWLLGVEEAEEAEEAAQPPERDFSDREWEIIDRLTQDRPSVPKWLRPLVIGAAALSLVAALMSGAALYSVRSQHRNLTVVSQAVAQLTAGSDWVGLDRGILDSFQFLIIPGGGMERFDFRFIGFPPAYADGTTAELVITADGEEICREECLWNGTCYSAEFSLEARNGYSAFLVLTEEGGIVRSTAVHDAALTNLLSASEFGNVSVTFDQAVYGTGDLTLKELRFLLDLPTVYRDLEDRWTRCDLVVLADGQELGRKDILNRSQYSKQVNFGENGVDFYSQSQTIPVGDLSGCCQVELLLDCEFTTGLQLQKVVHTWTVENGKLIP